MECCPRKHSLHVDVVTTPTFLVFAVRLARKGAIGSMGRQGENCLEDGKWARLALGVCAACICSCDDANRRIRRQQATGRYIIATSH